MTDNATPSESVQTSASRQEAPHAGCSLFPPARARGLHGAIVDYIFADLLDTGRYTPGYLRSLADELEKCVEETHGRRQGLDLAYADLEEHPDLVSMGSTAPGPSSEPYTPVEVIFDFLAGHCYTPHDLRKIADELEINAKESGVVFVRHELPGLASHLDLSIRYLNRKAR